MKKNHLQFLIFFLTVFLTCTTCFTACKTKHEINKISLIVSNMYGSIRPVDIYEIQGGSIRFTKSNKVITMEKKYSFCAISFSETKMDSITRTDYVIGLQLDNKYKISVWDIENSRPAFGYVKPENRRLYSEYYGEKEFVASTTNVSFYKTLPIKLEEKADTFKITYYKYNSSSFSVPICFNDYETTIIEYKKVIEVLKTDIKKIEYFA